MIEFLRRPGDDWSWWNEYEMRFRHSLFLYGKKVGISAFLRTLNVGGVRKLHLE
jgi:hypothetical protein